MISRNLEELAPIPYITGRPVTGDEFFGRKILLEAIIEDLQNGQQVLSLIGLRRSGKTSVLKEIELLNPEGFVPVFFDLQPLTERPLCEALKELANEIAGKLNLPFVNSVCSADYFYNEFLSKVSNKLEGDRRIVFLIDEFDVVDSPEELADNTTGRSFFQFLSRGMIYNSSMAFIFAAGRHEEEFSLKQQYLLKASRKHEIWVLDRKSAEELVNLAQEQNLVRFSPGTVEYILQVTSCHPYLIQSLCFEIAAGIRGENPPVVNIEQVEENIEKALENYSGPLIWMWHGIPQEERIYLSALAETVEEGESASYKMLVKNCQRHKALLEIPHVRSAPRTLIRRKLIESIDKNQHRFTIEVLRRWVKKNKSLSDIIDEIERVEAVQNIFEEGVDSFSREKWESAIYRFREVLKKSPFHFQARIHLGKSLLKAGRVEEAIDAFRNAYEIDQEEARLDLCKAKIQRGRSLLRVGRVEESINELREAYEIDAEEASLDLCRAKVQLGRMHLKRGKVKAAIDELRGAYEIDPREARLDLCEVLMTRAKTFYGKEEYRDTITRCQEIIDICEDHFGAESDRRVQELYNNAQSLYRNIWTKIGDEALRNNNLQESLEAYQRAKNEDRMELVKARKEQSSPPVSTPSIKSPVQIKEASWTLANTVRMGIVEEISYSPDGNWIAAATSSGIYLIDTRTQELRPIGEQFEVTSIAFSPRGDKLVVGLSTGEIQLFKVPQGILVSRLRERGERVNSVVFSLDNTRVATGTNAKEVEIWDVSRGIVLRRLTGHTDWVRDVMFSPSGERLASGADDETVRLWQVETGLQLSTMKGHQGWVRNISFSPNGQILASGDREAIRIWNAVDGALLVKHQVENAVQSITFSPDDMLLAAGTEKHEVHIWNTSDWDLLGILDVSKYTVKSIAFAPTGRKLVVGLGNGAVEFYDLKLE